MDDIIITELEKIISDLKEEILIKEEEMDNLLNEINE